MPIPLVHLVQADITVEVMPIPEMSVAGAEEVQQMLQPISYTKQEDYSTLIKAAVVFRVTDYPFQMTTHFTGVRE